MTHNKMKRVLAATFSLLTVAAPMTANVGGFLKDVAIVASADDPSPVLYKQLGGMLSVAEDTVPYIEGVYEITEDAAKKQYTKVSGTDLFRLASNKEYCVRTTAKLSTSGDATAPKLGTAATADLNGVALEDGVYEYHVQQIASTDIINAVTAKVTVSAGFTAETFKIKQNGKEIILKDGNYTVAEGYPVEFTVTPGIAHTTSMLAATNANVVSQTKASGAITLKFVPTANSVVNWTEYKPTLQLTKNANGTITATDIGFNELISNEIVGNYTLRYGTASGSKFTYATQNSDGSYVKDGTHTANVNYSPKTLRVKQTDVQYLENVGDITTTYSKKKIDGTWEQLNSVNDTKEAGTYKAVTIIEANADEAVLSGGSFKIETEFKVVDVGILNAEIDFKIGNRPIAPDASGVYSVSWTGDEITPTVAWMDGNNAIDTNKYFITGTTTAIDPGTYTITLSPVDDKINQGKDKTVTWRIANDNNYVTLKESAVADAYGNYFTIGYRQATSTKILEEAIAKKLDFVGSDVLTVVKYTEMIDDGEGELVERNEVDDPTVKVGTYKAYVANAVANDGKTSAMKHDGDAVSLLEVQFEVTQTVVEVVPSITEITYGDDVELSSLYKVVDKATKEEIGVAWKIAPKLKLVSAGGAEYTSTKAMDAGEYTYTVNAELKDKDNYSFQAADDVKFTVNKRNIKDMKFGTVKVEVPAGGKYVKITAADIADAANQMDNPTKFNYNPGDNSAAASTNDLQISGGYVTAKATEIGKVLTVNVKGTGNFVGNAQVSWTVGGQIMDAKVATYEAEFDASKPRIMASFDTTKIDGEIEEVGFYFSNNGKIDVNAGDANIQATLVKADFGTDAQKNPLNSKKVTFNATAIAKAVKDNKGVVTVEIANSSVLKKVVVMPYVKFKNGEVAYDKIDKMNYYDMVMTAEGALDVKKTDVVGTGTTNADGVVLTKGKTYVKVDVTRVNKKGYEVLDYGVVYNNSASWGNNVAEGTLSSAAEWLTLDNTSEKTVKFQGLSESEVNTKIGVYVYILNSTAVDGSGNSTGVGAKKVFCKAAIRIKDASGNIKTYYSNLSDATYGGFTLNPETGANTDKVDSKNNTQIEFYALNDEGTAYERKAASTGEKSYTAWWTETHKN